MGINYDVYFYYKVNKIENIEKTANNIEKIIDKYADILGSQVFELKTRKYKGVVNFCINLTECNIYFLISEILENEKNVYSYNYFNLDIEGV